MDAKAKVVAYMVTEPATAISLKSSYAYTLEECDNAVNPDHEPLIKLTDHESALAEMEFSRNEWMKGAADLAEKLKASELRNATLITGLEALAGEWELIAGRPNPVADDYYAGQQYGFRVAFQQLRRTLASSATGEKNTEEEMK